MSNAKSDLKAFYDVQVEQDNNVIATFTDKNGDIIVLVLDDSPEKISKYASRSTDIRFIKTDKIVAYQDPTKKFRPAPGGVSVGHFNITAGTLGTWVIDKADRSVSILSNNHVLADINAGVSGDDILQPGKADGGVRAGDTIADLTRFVRLSNNVTVDAAIAKVRNQTDVDIRVLSVGYLYGISESYMDQKIWKYGRTSRLTRGTVIAVDATVQVDYGNRMITLTDCIISTIASQPGDSGSAFVDFGSNNLVGLLFAGNGSITIGCKATNVVKLLDIEMVAPPETMRSQWVDISHWQGDITSFSSADEVFRSGYPKINIPGLTASTFATMKSKGVRGVIMKVCQGSNIIDSRFIEYYDAARSAGLLVGGYIYVDPTSGGSQAHLDNYYRAIGNRTFDIPVTLDVEKAGSGLKSIVDGLCNSLNPIIYTAVSFWNDNIGTLSVNKKPPLWIAYWSNTAVTPVVPIYWSGTEPVLWQYDVSDAGSWFGVSSSQIDLDLTFPSFEKLLGGITPPPVPTPSSSPSPSTPPTEPAEFIHNKGRVLVNLNYRSGPGTGYTRLGTMTPGTIIEIIETTMVSGNKWAKIGYKEWCAMIYSGAEYVEYVLEGE